MKKYLIITLIVLMILPLTGCGIFNLTGFVLPDDDEFIAVIDSLYTPELVCNYIRDNFEFSLNVFYTPDPYEVWQNKEGDCNDFVTFAMYAVEYNGSKSYLVKIWYAGTYKKHTIIVFEEEGKYTYGSTRKDNTMAYYPLYVNTFNDVIESYANRVGKEVSKYVIYDYWDNVIEE